MGLVKTVNTVIVGPAFTLCSFLNNSVCVLFAPYYFVYAYFLVIRYLEMSPRCQSFHDSHILVCHPIPSEVVNHRIIRRTLGHTVGDLGDSGLLRHSVPSTGVQRLSNYQNGVLGTHCVCVSVSRFQPWSHSVAS